MGETGRSTQDGAAPQGKGGPRKGGATGEGGLGKENDSRGFDALRRDEGPVNVAEIMKVMEREAARKKERYNARGVSVRRGAGGTRQSPVVAVKTLIVRMARATGTEDILGRAANRFGRRAPASGRERIGVGELLRYDDIDFVRAAYGGLLGREPDPIGLREYLSALRTFTVDKIEVLQHLQSSAEGRQKGVKVVGLRRRYLLYRAVKAWSMVPFIGKPFDLMLTFARMRPYIRQLPVFAETSSRSAEELRESLLAEVQAVKDVLNRKVEALPMSALEDCVRELYGRSLSMDHRLGAVGDLLKRLQQRTQDLEESFGKTDEILSGLSPALLSADRGMRMIDDRLNNVEERIGDMAGEDRLPDNLYLQFENRFRGSREAIREKLSIYVPYIERSGAGKEDTLILDVGCGRGEWLELIAEKGLYGRGIDSNESMVRFCCDRGLAVSHGDAPACLNEEASESLGAVTGFHVVEHLAPAVLADLFAQVLRVLKPGGIGIFETPNPENLIVGACNFYFDPTHRRPVPPAALSFLMEATGFRDVEVIRLHPNDGFRALPADAGDEALNLFQGPQDYVVIGYKGA